MTTIILLSIAIALIVINIIIASTKKIRFNAEELKMQLQKIETGLSKSDLMQRDEFSRGRAENQQAFRDNREELIKSFKTLGETLSKNVTDLSAAQRNQFSTFTQQLKDFNELLDKKFEELFKRQEAVKKETESKLGEIRDTVEGKLKSLQEDNSKKLEEMRKVVDEKLQDTVEKRFNQSFKVISDRLELVHKGLGEMQILASDVGDLKKVFSNVSTRGHLGEVQLGAILEQILSSEQYEQNVSVKKGSQERVEYAIKLPGKNKNDQSLLLPIDSKFPIEDYQKLQAAYDQVTQDSKKQLAIVFKQFESAIKKNAKDIWDKYINPPTTTDFAIMFVPTEGLYAEILRRPGLFETLQRQYRVTVVGPTNLVAFLSSLQMGFKTLAIEKRSSEVWDLLGAVKNEFGKFGEVLEKTKKKLQEASNVIDDASVRSRVIERKLRKVQELPIEKSQALLEDDQEFDGEEPTMMIETDLKD